MFDPRHPAHGNEGDIVLFSFINRSFIYVQDFAAAAKLLEPLCEQGPELTSPALRSGVARIYLQSGNLGMAARHIAVVAEDPNTPPSLKAMNAALLAAAEGEWEQASEILKSNLLAENPDNHVVRHLNALYFPVY